MAELNSLLSTILEKQIPQREQLQRENERNRRFGTIRQGSILDSIPNIIRPEFFKPEANIDPTTGAPEKNFGHFLTSGFGNTASNTASGVDALTMLLLAGGGAKLGSKFLKGLGEKGAFDASSINALLEKIRKFNNQQGGQAKDNTFRDAPVPNPPGFRRRDMIGTNIRESRSQARELRHFKNKNLELEEHMMLVKQDLAKLTDPHSTARTRKEMAVRLKRNDRMANDALSQMSPEDQKQVRRVLQKLREENG